MQGGGHPPSWNSLNRHILTKNYSIFMKFGTEQQIMNLMTVTPSKIKILQIQDNGWPPYLKSFVVHNSAADCPMSVKLCVRMQLFGKFRQLDRYPRSTERIFCFSYSLGFGRSRHFSYRLRYTCWNLILDEVTYSINMYEPWDMAPWNTF